MVDRRDLDVGPPTLVGTVLLAKWRIVRPIARGGTSTVYEAVHRNGRRAAVKVLHPRLAADTIGRARFRRESLLVNRVNHPGVVPVIDDDVAADGTVFLVMDLLDGQTLDDRWKQCGRALSPGETLTILAETLDVLAAVHAAGIVHRDLKPSNVFLSRGVVKLLDFGVACLREAADDDATLTRSGSLLGTPAFMAPEQARGHWNAVDARTDIWAVGAIGFCLLAGRFVHEGGTPHELLIATATKTPVSLGRVAPNVPVPIVQLIDRALRLKRADRWSDAQAMLAALRNAQATCPKDSQTWLEPGTPDVSTAQNLAVTTMTSQSELSRPVRTARGLSRFVPRGSAAWSLLGGGMALVTLVGSGRLSFIGKHAAGASSPPQTSSADATRGRELESRALARSDHRAEGELKVESSSSEVAELNARAVRVAPPANSSPDSRVRAQRDPPPLIHAPARPKPVVSRLKTQQVFSGVVVDDDELDRR